MLGGHCALSQSGIVAVVDVLDVDQKNEKGCLNHLLIKNMTKCRVLLRVK